MRVLASAMCGALIAPVFAQTAGQSPQSSKAASSQTANASTAAPGGVATPPGGAVIPPTYVIGVDDLLSIRFWGDAQLTADVVVRPDGKISLPLLNDVQAAGLTPEQLATALEKAATRFVTEPDATIIVREVRSRKVFVLGAGVARPGVVPLNTDMNVLQVLAASGGLLEYANKSDIVIVRKENGREQRLKFNFDEVVKGKKPQQNILLQPGDTILVN